MTKPPRPIPKKKPNPFLGFTWVGWVAVLVLAVLAIAAHRGWDPIYDLMWFIGLVLRLDADRFGSAYVLVQVYWCQGWHFSIMNGLAIGAILIWASMQGAAKLQWAVMIGLWSIATTVMSYYVIRAPVGGPIGSPGHYWWLFYAEVAICCVTLALGHLATRSWLLPGFWLFMMAQQWYFDGSFHFGWPITLFGMDLEEYWRLWNFVFVLGTLAWSSIAIRRLHTGLICPACEYDLTNLPSKTCPECGNDISDVLKQQA